MITRKKVFLSKILMLLMAVSFTLFENNLKANAEIIKFKDENFQKFVLRETCHQTPSYTNEELKAYRYVNIYDKNEVWSVDGLQYFPNIWSFNIWQSSISDLTPISNTTNITELNLRNSCITNLAPIKNLTKVKKLTCYNLNLDNYSAIANLKNLEYLELDNCNIKDLSVLKNLKKLKSLKLKNNYIEDISILGNLNELRTIWLDNNEIKDISPLLNLPSYAGRNDTSSYAKEIQLNDNMLDSNKDGQVLKTLRNKGYKVTCDNRKRDEHVVNINGKRYNTDNAVNPSNNISLEFNKDMSNFQKNYCLKVYVNNNSVNVPFSTIGNTLIVNLNGLCKDKDFISLAVWKSSGQYLYSIFMDKDTSIKGDMNGNSKIDLYDLTEIAKSYNKNSKDAVSWDIRKDVNRDGIIDIYDLTKVSSYM